MSYSCKNCRIALFTQSCIISHAPGQGIPEKSRQKVQGSDDVVPSEQIWDSDESDSDDRPTWLKREHKKNATREKADKHQKGLERKITQHKNRERRIQKHGFSFQSTETREKGDNVANSASKKMNKQARQAKIRENQKKGLQPKLEREKLLAQKKEAKKREQELKENERLKKELEERQNTLEAQILKDFLS